MKSSSKASEESGSSEAAAPSPTPASDGRRTARTSASVVVGRLLLLLAAATALAAAMVLTRARDRERERADKSSVVYLCPMHPEVVSPVPGDCPICGMALERGSGAQEAPRTGAGPSRRIGEVQRRVVTQVIRGPAWLAPDGSVTAILHKDDLVGLAPGERALFFPRATPAAGQSIRTSSETPAPWDGSTVKVRFHLDQPAEAPMTMTGWVQLAARPRELTVVPESAVLYSGEGPYVLAAPAGSHTFTRRSVEIGRILDSGHVADLSGDHYGLIVVLSGLQAGERVVVDDTFFLDAERRLQAAQGRPAEVVE